MRTPVALPLLMLVAGCQEPFGTDRHDLVGFRVAAVRVGLDDDTLHARVAVVVDGRPWSDDRVALAWHFVDDTSTRTIAALELDGADGYGPEPELERWEGRAGLALVAVAGDDVYRALIELPATIGPSPGPTRVDTLGLPMDLATVAAADLDLTARRGVADGAPIDTVPGGAFARLRTDVPPDVRVRWMSTAPGGTFLELDRRTADWVAGDLIVDDDEIETATPHPDGPRTVLALALDPAAGGANAWVAHDLWIGDAPSGVRTRTGRWLATDAPVGGPYVQGTLVADDDQPTGLRLAGATDVDPDTNPGTAGLDCRAEVGGPFDPMWLFEQRCTRTEVLGATVVVVTR